jgi:predicted SprT family Zn-dependent metalloprotease
MTAQHSPDDDPTRSQFGPYCKAFDYFNGRLFDGGLPRVMLFFRGRTSLGLFSPQRWACQGGQTHEISLNPKLLHRDVEDTMSTLVHEMAHLWQEENGRPSHGNYHNREWADRMITLGLMPSQTAQPGGRQTGRPMSHYIIADGAFQLAFRAMPEEYLLPWRTPVMPSTRQHYQKNKTLYVCAGCHDKAWGKPGLSLICGRCGTAFAAC